MTVYDTEGRSYLDFGSGIAVNALGHADPEIVAAIQEQAVQLSHVSNLFHSIPQAELAKMFCDLSFADKVFFCNSGTEANEAAIKFARKYGQSMHHPSKNQVVAFTGAFHGRTIGALSITPRAKYQMGFQPLMPGVHFAPFNDVEAAAKLIGPDICAVFVEPVQGEGGIHVATQAFIMALRELCDQFGALLVFDEIQCGLGRTGKLWAYENYDVEPDIMTLAKALGGGLPIGAVLLTNRIAQAIEIGDHGSTFGGGPIAAKAAQVVLRRVSDKAMLAHVSAMGEMLMSGLNGIASTHIKDVRGMGLMIGVEMDQEVKPIIEAGYERGIILLSAGPYVIRLLPPVIMSGSDIEQVLQVLTEILEG